jgi:hypothetical protein
MRLGEEADGCNPKRRYGELPKVVAVGLIQGFAATRSGEAAHGTAAAFLEKLAIGGFSGPPV